jgi:signal transduction histidine kinase
MSKRTASRLAWCISVITLILAATTLLLGLTRSSSVPGLRPFGATDALLLAALATFPAVGAVIASRRPENHLWLILCAIGLTAVLNDSFFSHEYAAYALLRRPGSLPAGEVAAWVSGWLYAATAGLPALLLLLFPTGRLPSPRWRWVLWLAGVQAATGFVGFGFLSSASSSPIHNPLGIQSARGLMGTLSTASILLQFVLVIAAVISLIMRFRRSGGEERQQLKWLTYAAGMAPVSIIVWSLYLGAIGGKNPLIESLIGVFAFISIISLPIAIGVAILKYRLYDIDIVINRTVVYGSLAAFISAAYVAIVVGIGSLVGNQGKTNLALSIAAAALVAMAFQPVRERLQRLANRLVYGKRAAPYDVLSGFSERMSETYATEELLPRMARVLAEGTGAARAEVWLKVGAELRPAAAWPGEAAAADPRRVAGDIMPAMPDADRAVAVLHQGELLGALTIIKRAGESLTPIEEKLMSDLALQAGLVLKNVGLTAELVARLEELRASRQRLVAAQDTERRRLERDLHDGLQQELVAMLAKIRIARNQAARDPRAVDATLEELHQEIRQALKDLRELAKGIHPPILSDRGLLKAIEARVAHLPIGVTVEADDGLASSRYPEEVEGAAYFFVCEGLANVLKHASAKETTIRLSSVNGSLQVEVIDDGRGFDAARVTRSGLSGLEDRIEAVGGTLSITSRLEGGTRITARLPARRASPV